MAVQFIDLKPQYQALKSSIDHRLKSVFEHGQFIMGPEVTELEQTLAKFTGAPYVISCANGTDALVLSFRALGIGPGDEVIVPGWSFIAQAETVVLVGAKPVFVDICKDTYNIDAKLIENAITDRTKAIVPVSLYGLPSDMNAINKIAEKHNLPVIEDAAQSIGSSYHGKNSGNLSKLATTSFYPAKPLGCFGDGGAVFTDDEALAKKLQSLRFHGMSETERYKHINIGTNSRLDTVQAAILLSKMERFSWEVERRSYLGQKYTDALKGRVKIQRVDSGLSSIYAQYTIWSETRDELRSGLQEKGIPTAIHYPMPMYRQEAYKDFLNGENLENCEWAAQGVLSLPMYPDMSEETQDLIINAIVSLT